MVDKKSQKLSIRLLQKGVSIEQSLSKVVDPVDWKLLDDAHLYAGFIHNSESPKWAKFLNLSDEAQGEMYSHQNFSLLFVPASERIFVVTFGPAHSRIDSSMIEQDFGLRVVINCVDHNMLKSADIRTPDDNTLSRRSQVSRASEQSTLGINPEYDILRGLKGVPTDKGFATQVSGSDVLTLSQKMEVSDIPEICKKAYEYYQSDKYKEHFPWIDYIRHIRDKTLIGKLKGSAIQTINEAYLGESAESVHLAIPEIYNPEDISRFRYRGFRCKESWPELEIENYFDALRSMKKEGFDEECFDRHTVRQVDDDDDRVGKEWKLSDCLVCDVLLDDRRFVLSGGQWYEIARDYGEEVRKYFDKADEVNLPPAHFGENEVKYNERIALGCSQLHCMDRDLVYTTIAPQGIEVCDFFELKTNALNLFT